VPILGVNLGKVGFITEIGVNELSPGLPDLLKTAGWIEERAMLEAQLEDRKFHALNEVVLRMVRCSFSFSSNLIHHLNHPIAQFFDIPIYIV